jgi:hypothetical protein
VRVKVRVSATAVMGCRAGVVFMRGSEG